MTVKELKQLLSDAPDDMRVYIGDVTELGMFCFKEACICDSGPMEFAPADHEIGEHGEGEGFVLMPHGLSVAEGDEDEQVERPEDLN